MYSGFRVFGLRFGGLGLGTVSWDTRQANSASSPGDKLLLQGPTYVDPFHYGKPMFARMCAVPTCQARATAAEAIGRRPRNPTTRNCPFKRTCSCIITLVAFTYKPMRQKTKNAKPEVLVWVSLLVLTAPRTLHRNTTILYPTLR